MFYYVVAPNSWANRARRWLRSRHRRTVPLRAEEQLCARARVIFEDAKGHLCFGRVLTATVAPKNTVVAGHIVALDPSPSHDSYQPYHLRRLATERYTQVSRV